MRSLEKENEKDYNGEEEQTRAGPRKGREEMALKYPKNPHFNKLQMRTSDYENWQEGCAHDPSLLEWEGKYYAYSTDTFGAPSGCQIRKSEDLFHWEYLGSALPMEGSAARYREGSGEMQSVYDWCVTAQGDIGYGICTRKDGNMSFWAPHCVRGADGKFWLYFCLTGYFGGSKSCIALAKSDTPEGNFRLVSLIVQSPSGWRTPNAIDPQFVVAGERRYLVYGSFGLGIFLLELDPATGLRKDKRKYDDFAKHRCSFEEYYGIRLASGSLEGPVIRYHEGVDVLEKGKWVKKNYYYLMCSYGSLSSVYQMRCGRSEQVEGPYLDINGNPLVCSSDIGTGNKMLGSFRWADSEVDFFCPGHNDMFVTESGVKLISYHCRTNYFIDKKLSRSNNFHYLYLGQYDINAEGWPVMNANRYAGEEIQDVTPEELLNITAGKFEAVMFTQRTDTVVSRRIVLHADGTIAGGYQGRWKMFGSRYITLEIGKNVYSGVVMPAWMDGQHVAGLTVTAMGSPCGMALHLNSTYKI